MPTDQQQAFSIRSGDSFAAKTLSSPNGLLGGPRRGIAPFEKFDGGLKWTRTTDPHLIRVVL